MEIEYFVHENEWEKAFEQWRTDIKKFLKELGLPEGKVHELEVPDSDRAHYSKRTIDFEFDFPIGREELLGLAYRTDFDLQNIQKASGKSMEYRPKDGGAAVCAARHRAELWPGTRRHGRADRRLHRGRSQRRKAQLT